ncbi:MAG: hypothetical protein AAF799_32325 [Myxococcota bacterium]
MRRRLLTSLALLTAATTVGCVYPATEPTGVELSWRFMESNTVDGEEATAVRTCVGAFVEQVAIQIEDADDPTRDGIFRFECMTGFQTAVDAQVEASDAFVRLDPGPYILRINAVDDADEANIEELVAVREIDVDDRGVTLMTTALQRATVELDLSLNGTESCDALALQLRYASPQTDLADYPEVTDDDPPLYRSALVSDRGLGLGGAQTACGAEVAGAHLFSEIDRGEYLLTVDVDGRACSVTLDLRGPDGVVSVIDLANLPCPG